MDTHKKMDKQGKRSIKVIKKYNKIIEYIRNNKEFIQSIN